MKNTLLIALWLCLGWSAQAQISAAGIEEPEKEPLGLKNVLSQEYPRCGYLYHELDVFAKEEKVEKKDPRIRKLPVAVKTKGPALKIYELKAETEHWFRTQDVYRSLIAKVPGVRISNIGLHQTPHISIRGDANTIVIVDGIRYDTSILNSLNPQDIQSIKVSANPAAATYFIANQN